MTTVNINKFPPIIVFAYRPNYYYETRCGDVYRSDSEKELLTNQLGDTELINNMAQLMWESHSDGDQSEWEFSVIIEGLTPSHDDYPFWTNDELRSLVNLAYSDKKEDARKKAELDQERKLKEEEDRKAALRIKAENEEKALYLTLKSKYQDSL